jgi:hypothetical protein
LRGKGGEGIFVELVSFFLYIVLATPFCIILLHHDSHT